MDVVLLGPGVNALGSRKDTEKVTELHERRKKEKWA